MKLCKTPMAKKFVSSIIKCMDDKKIYKKMLGFCIIYLTQIFMQTKFSVNMLT